MLYRYSYFGELVLEQVSNIHFKRGTYLVLSALYTRTDTGSRTELELLVTQSPYWEKGKGI